ncbi:NYN domain-containing protein [Leptolyngbya sp. O-77]|uniref:NYN domain-containing protein n=1 Tax=Leptolyngbya sp. O-77 TaxID=1080068 RepID=UPI00074D3D2D|nr:NYN domain-containing protein [Leptolyngbya sp. O-77]BAU43131.1 YacP-like NYN domain protein [Leptolyngbya sp. O-77]
MPRRRPVFQAILLVDGYNVIGAWEVLRQLRDRQGLEEARRGLVESLVGYSSFQGYNTQVVFDAQYQDTPGSRETITENLCICYTDFQQTADTFIELACSRFRNDLRKFEQRLIVATSDRAQQQTVIGYGAELMSAQRLLSEVEAAERRVRQRQFTKGRSPGRFLANSLDPQAREKLSRLRFGELEPEQP